MSAEDDVGMPPYRPMPMPEPGKHAPDAPEMEMPKFELPEMDIGEDEEEGEGEGE